MSPITDEIVLANLIRARAETQPDLDVLTFEHFSLDGGRTPDEVRTYAELANNSNELAAWLISKGMARGDRFALMAQNHPEFVEAMIAASITGTVYVPVDPRTKVDKLAYVVANSGSKGIICSDMALPQVLELKRMNSALEWVLVIPTGESQAQTAETFVGIETFEEALSGNSETVDIRLQSVSDPLSIMYTSGTTGDPKGILKPNGQYSPMHLGTLFGYAEDERPYTGLSLTHGNAHASALNPALVSGHRAIFSRRFTKSKLWDVCRAYGATTFSLLGGMATAVYSEPPRDDDGDNPIRFVLSAGMPAAIWEGFEERFNVKILEWYGAMEGGLAMKPIGQGPVGSFGKPVATLEMKILDENDEECPPGVLGEICSRPRNIAPEVTYFGNPEASEEKTRGGWLRSGDIGHTDEDGWFFFDYRKGGGIRRNGDFVNPGFVEGVLANHPQIDDVFVYGVPAASGAPGEKDVVAAVVVAPGVTLDIKNVFDHCKNGLEPNFVPSYLHLVSEIPKTASEKPQERFLVERFEQDREAGLVKTEA